MRNGGHDDQGMPGKMPRENGKGQQRISRDCSQEEALARSQQEPHRSVSSGRCGMAVMMTKGCQARCQGKTEKDNNGSAGIALRKRHWHGASRNRTGVCHQDDEERLVRMTSETGQDAKGKWKRTTTDQQGLLSGRGTGTEPAGTAQECVIRTMRSGWSG